MTDLICIEARKAGRIVDHRSSADGDSLPSPEAPPFDGGNARKSGASPSAHSHDEDGA